MNTLDQLSELQLDALTEIFNIGTGRAAASLSDIVGSEVTLSVPRIQFFQSSEVNAALLSINSPRIGAVRQIFSGSVNTNALLLFTEDRALEIVRDMMGSQLSTEELVEFEQEALSELGNIILNACMSAMSDLLHFTLHSSLPTYSTGPTETMLRQIIAQTDQPTMLLLHIDLTIEKHQSQGQLIFILSSSSFHELLAHVDQFIANI